MATEEPVPATELAASVFETAVTVLVDSEPSAEAAGGKPKKARKTSAKRKPKIGSLHPPYFEMIKDAILTLKERSGSSQYAIAKFVEEKHKNLPANFKKVLSIQLKRLVAEGKLVKVKASYKLPATKVPAAAAPAKKNKPAAKPKPKPKPKASAKPKPAAKKAPAKKKPTANPKPAPKAKAVAKPAAKPKPVAKAKAPSKPAAKTKAKTPTKPAKVAKTSTRSTPGGKAAPAAKPARVARTPGKKQATKSVKAKTATPKKTTAARKAKK